MTKELRVLLSDNEIGSVHQNKYGRLTFTYDDEWRERIDSVPLSLSMPLTQKNTGLERQRITSGASVLMIPEHEMRWQNGKVSRHATRLR
jgi:HipA-like protein